MAGQALVTSKKFAPKPEPESIPLEARIRQRAYELYLQRGDAEGSAVGDWLQAEAEIDTDQEIGQAAHANAE